MVQERIGRYEIKRTLGRGAMGVVYLAFDPALDRHSAIKVMTTSGEIDEELRARFFREARSAAKIRHPNIIAIYDMGEDQNRPYIAMEYLEGDDLRTLIEKRVFIPFEKKLDFIIQTCRGLHYAHQHGVIHRDIKPANIFVTLDGEVRILDFGLARLESSELTRAGMIMGTPYYMSPEQVRGSRDLDGRSDLFSVVVLLYELIAYTRPFEADNLTGVCFKIVSEPHPPISQFLHGCAEELVQIIDRALSKDRNARFATGEELAEALKEFQQKVPIKLQELRPKVESIEAEFKKLQNNSSHLIGMDLLQPKLLEVEESVADPTATVLLTQGETTLGPLNDYGSLLLRQGSLHQRLEAVNRTLVEVSALAQLFETGRQQFEKGELDASLATLEKILSVQPKNAKALEMQEECLRLLEERRRQERQSNLNLALGQVLEAFDQGNYEQCLQAVSRAFEFDPDNTQALQIQQQASEALRRRGRVAELLKAAQGHEQGGDYEACLRAATEGLGLDREHKELGQLQHRAQQELERRRRVNELLKQARQQAQAKDYTAALKTVEEWLRVEPGQGEALELKRQASEALQQRGRVEELLKAAQGHEQEGDYEACLRAASEGLGLDREHKELGRLQQRAQQELEKRRRVNELLKQARQQVQAKNYAAAVKIAEELLRVEPGQGEALELKRQATEALQRQRRVAELLKAAQGHERGGDYEACLRAATEGLGLDREHQELVQLQQRAQQILEKRRLDDERRARVSELLGVARKEIGDNKFSSAVRNLNLLLQLEPGNTNASSLRQEAQAALSARRHKTIRKASLVVGPLLLVSLAVGGLLRLFYQKESPVQLNLPSEVKPKPPSSAEPASASQPTPSKDDAEITRGLEAASKHLDAQEYSEAASEAAKVLERSPGHLEGERLQQQARESLDKIANSNQRAKALYEAGKNEEAIAALGEVLKLSPSNREARQLLSQLERFAGKGAEEALAQLRQAKSEAEGAKALELASGQFETARSLEAKAIRLYKAKQYGQATPKLFEAREAYRRAALEAQAKEKERGLAAQRAQAQAEEHERQQATKRAAAEERERLQQIAVLRDRAVVSQQAFEKIRAKASEAGAEGRATDLFRQATGSASEARTKLDQGDFAGAQHSYELASTQMERAMASAEAALQAEAKKQEPTHNAVEKGSDLRLIEEVLRSYKAAYEGKDLEALRTLWPSLADNQAKKLGEYFKFARSIQVDLQPIDPPRVAGETATVTCRRVDQVVTVDGKKIKNETNTTLNLRKKGLSWTIEAIR